MVDPRRLRAHGGMNGYIHPAMSVLRNIILFVCGAVLLASCSGSASRNSERSIALLEAELAAASWSAQQVRAHLMYLDGVDLEGRESATRGFSRTAAYIAARLKGFGIQPVLAGEYRWQYATRNSAVISSSVQLLSPDSLQLIRGEDYLLTGVEKSVQMAGQGRLPQNVPGLQWNTEIDSLSRSGMWKWDVSIDVESGINLSSMHIAGFLPGAKPQERDSLVILVAPIDGMGMQGNLSWSDGSDSALPAATLLEVTRRLSSLQRTWSLFGSSMMIVFVSGTRSECSGVDAFLTHLPWDRSHVQAVHLLDIREPQACRWKERMAEHGLETSEIIFHQVYAPSIESSILGFDGWFPRSDLLRSGALEQATNEVIRAAAHVMDAMPKE